MAEKADGKAEVTKTKNAVKTVLPEVEEILYKLFEDEQSRAKQEGLIMEGETAHKPVIEAVYCTEAYKELEQHMPKKLSIESCRNWLRKIVQSKRKNTA